MSKFHVGVVCGILVGLVAMWLGMSIREFLRERGRGSRGDRKYDNSMDRLGK